METRKAICYNCFQEKPDADGLCPHCGFDLAENEKKFPVALRAGTVLNDRYIIGRVLGQGGFGITYLALDTQLNAKVAIKEFMPGEIATRVGGTTVSVMMDTKSEEFAYGAERFQEEARTLAKFIGNPNIAAVTSYFDENDTSYFVMDYIEGISFKTYIANHGGNISVVETLNVMIPVLRALTAVHAEGFIHRDVTPDNIYITKDGIVKLLDFGSARYSIGDKSKSLDVILKVGYAPKEQYIRRSRQGPFTDVYSCAACFYAAISGFLPPESLERMDEDTLVPISQCGIEIPEYLDKAILKGLAVQPEDRFQNAAEFLDAIESQQVVEVPGTVPATPTVGGQVDALLENVKQRPKFYAAIAAAAVILLLAAGMLSGGPSAPDDAGEPLPVVENEEIPEQPELPEPEPEPVMLTIAGEEHSSNDTYLSLWQVELTAEDIENICQMQDLEELSIYECYSDDDFAFLPRLTSLKSLDWTLNNGEQLANLTDCTQLTSLRIGWGDGTLITSNLDFLAGMTDLESLDLHVYGLEDTSALANLTKLTHFTIAGGQIHADMSVLAGMTEMVDLQINSSNIRSSYPPYDKNGYVAPDLGFLANMSKLESAFLYFQENVNSIAGLEGAVNLRDLDMTVGSVSSLEPFASLTSLRKLELDVSASNLSLEPLRGLEKLETFVTYSSRYFTDWSALDHVPSVDRRA
ncbi:protein kinase [uncultured Oscillibacter sp.]|uniref:protein kinase domain-containing protein n=1 Tax=uncultured Oscillibacter sp. TaxID=876091 RepID=UPI00260974B3|nr:protein kinase [uncultured Oscillibacter sp.]